MSGLTLTLFGISIFSLGLGCGLIFAAWLQLRMERKQRESKTTIVHMGEFK